MSKELLFERKNGFEGISKKDKNEIYDFCEEYRVAITKAKTEREFCDLSVSLLDKTGFVPLSEKSELKPGDRVYAINRGKGVTAF
ncbi:MAG: aminopeptidase, partial [Clostridia bacterium]|nr:aminopeptidase [Clostridia bacterium]